MELDGKQLIEGKFYLWKVATQAGTGVDLHSVFYVTEDNKFYEVVFTKAGSGAEANGWYLVEKKVKPEPVEAEIVEPVEPSEGGTLEVKVHDHMDIKAVFGQSGEEEKS